MNRLFAVGALALGIPVWFAACGGSGEPSVVSGGPDASAGSVATNTGGGQLGSGGSTNGSGGGGITLGGFGNGGPPKLDDACVANTQTGKLVPLDISIMLDSSGSMLDPTGANGTGVSKWVAVSAALNQFLSDPGSAELGVGIQYFPLQDPGAPASCRSNAACGTFGPCVLKFCMNAGPGIFPCDVPADCVAPAPLGDLGPCVPLRLCWSQLVAQGLVKNCHGDVDCGLLNDCVVYGECAGNTDFLCQYGNGTNVCGAGATALGACQTLTSACLHPSSCNAAQYAAPAVSIASLPAAAPALAASIAMHMPAGQTPTAPALSGAVQAARSWAGTHAGHTVIALLATDGLPTECIADPVLDATGIRGVVSAAAAGVAGVPSVATFVIGVFSPDDVALGARQNLDAIAVAGGSKSAFIVDTTRDVTGQFLAALNQIRGSKLGCEYQLPAAPTGETLDFRLVNVEVGNGTTSTPLYYVGADPSHCDPLTGGWYYDRDPTISAPTKILICPASCSAVEASQNASVQIALGCVAIVP